MSQNTLKDKDYLLGAAFTAPDAYLFTVLNWADFVQIDLKPWPRLTAYVARVRARAAVQKTLKSEGLIK